MPNVADIVTFLDRLAPKELAESWDNVGLLIGDRQRDVRNIMTCLSLTPDVALEAIEHGAQLIVAHHPVLFRPVKRLTGDDVQGKMLLGLIASGCAVYSPHTGFDSALSGINQQLAGLLGLEHVEPLLPAPGSAATSTSDSTAQAAPLAGTGRLGTLPRPLNLEQFTALVAQRLGVGHLAFVGDPAQIVRRVAIACGAGGDLLTAAMTRTCDVFLTGEARFHACLEARSAGIGLVLAGHYATERPGTEQLARVLSQAFPLLTIWPSERERDPLQWRTAAAPPAVT